MNELPDARKDLRAAQVWFAGLLDAVTPESLDRPTPCTDWTVRDLSRHLVGGARKLSVIGEGGDGASVGDAVDVADADLAHEYRRASLSSWPIWDNDDLLATTMRNGWAETPGAITMMSYAFETLGHGWDLARALGIDPEAPEALAERVEHYAMIGLPAESRQKHLSVYHTPQDAGPNAGPTTRLAAWLGREV